MKTLIEPEDIRKGDLIRIEVGPPRTYRAIEFQATRDRDRHWYGEDGGVFYLLERPKPSFEPYWGMVIGEREAHEDDGAGVKAVYVPTKDGYPWFSHPEHGSRYYYYSDGWAKQKLADGWVVIEKPEGVK